MSDNKLQNPALKGAPGERIYSSTRHVKFVATLSGWPNGVPLGPVQGLLDSVAQDRVAALTAVIGEKTTFDFWAHIEGDTVRAFSIQKPFNIPEMKKISVTGVIDVITDRN